jgi:DNA topoisomerase VI subunit A
MAQIDSGLDILALDFDVPRQQMSQLSANEKYANISPEADYVLMKLAPSLSQSLETDLAPGSVADLLSVHNCSLRLKVDSAIALCQRLNLTNLIVVENLDSFDHFFANSFTPDLQAFINNCMVLYRGSHDYSPAGRKRFLHLLESLNINVIGFTDLDPAGLMIANTLESCCSIIVPQLALASPDKLLALAQINSTDDFHKQHKQWAYLNNLYRDAHSGDKSDSQFSASSVIYNPQWLALVQWLGQHCVSIKQQHMLAKSMSLTLLNIHCSE